jgi:hypothetical protein
LHLSGDGEWCPAGDWSRRRALLIGAASADVRQIAAGVVQTVAADPDSSGFGA